jgi:hypothetical protein
MLSFSYSSNVRETFLTCGRGQPQPMGMDEQQNGEGEVEERLLPPVEPQHRVPAPIDWTVLVPATAA